jgi:hypothetical protein
VHAHEWYLVVLMVASRVPSCTVLFGSVNAGVTGVFQWDVRGVSAVRGNKTISAPPPSELKVDGCPHGLWSILRDA